MRTGRSISRCGCYCTKLVGHVGLRRQASSAAQRLSEARTQQRENESWAKQSGAREVLAQPPFGVECVEERASAATPGMLDSVEIYLKARRWHHPEGPARRFLSHLLTYPLTLAAGLHGAGLGSGPAAAVSTASTKLEPGAPLGVAGNRKEPDRDWTSSGGGDNSNSTNSTNSSRRLTVVCLGARAESSMPPAFWRETLFALPEVSHLTLHLIGPELSLPSGLAAGRRRQQAQAAAGDGVGSRVRGSPTPTTTAAVSVGARTADISWTRAMLGRAASGCVEGGEERVAAGSGVGEGLGSGMSSDSATAAAAAAAAADETVRKADAFVLFNPGLGHPHLKEGWDGALKRLLATGKPIVVSCHSWKDLDRDARLLREAGAVSCHYPGWAEEVEVEGRGGDGRGGGESDSVTPRENPFRSLMVSEDPLSPPGAEEVVSCNWGVMIVKGVEGGNIACSRSSAPRGSGGTSDGGNGTSGNL